MPVTPAAIKRQLISVTVKGRFISGTKLRSRTMHRKYSLGELDTLMATQNHESCYNRVIAHPYMKSVGIATVVSQHISKEHSPRVIIAVNDSSS